MPAMLLWCVFSPFLSVLQMVCFTTAGHIFLPFAQKPQAEKACSRPLILTHTSESRHWLAKPHQRDAFANTVRSLGIMDKNLALFF